MKPKKRPERDKATIWAALINAVALLASVLIQKLL